MAKLRVLIVDDEEGMLEVCRDTLRGLPDVQITTESQSTRAAERLATESFDLLIVDVRMPGLSGVDLLRLRGSATRIFIVLVLTAFPTVETAVESMKLGAADYITKPFLPDELLATVGRLLEERRLRQENLLLARQVEHAWRFGDIIGRGSAMQKVFETIRRVGGTDADVLVLGETGTGKELVARAIHQGSRRSSGRFVPVDCGAIPEDLLESEFFGHERGAFTGAVTRSLGLLEFSNRGTFFLDEVGELPVRLQAKLLRVLQERKIRRVGGTEEIDVDVRVIAATSRNLDQEIAEHRFRMDLYYRINVGASSCLRCARERMISRCWCRTFWNATPAKWARKPSASTPRPSRCLRASPGPATSVSCRMSSSERWRWRGATPSASRTCPTRSSPGPNSELRKPGRAAFSRCASSGSRPLRKSTWPHCCERPRAMSRRRRGRRSFPGERCTGC